MATTTERDSAENSIVAEARQIARATIADARRKGLPIDDAEASVLAAQVEEQILKVWAAAQLQGIVGRKLVVPAETLNRLGDRISRLAKRVVVGE